jgi:small-conductance mechanosensitive channel
LSKGLRFKMTDDRSLSGVAVPGRGWKSVRMRGCDGAVLRGLAITTACWIAIVPAPLAGQDASPVPSPPATATAIAPVSLPDVPARAVDAAGTLRSMETGLDPSPDIVAIEDALPEFSRQLVGEVTRTRAIVAGVPTADMLRELDAAWSARRTRLSSWSASLQERSRALESNLDHLATMQIVWSKTREHAVESSAPAVILSRISEVLDDIRSLAKRSKRRQAEILTLQETTGTVGAAADSVLADIKHARTALVGQLLERQGAPIWKWFRGFDDGYTFLSRAGESFGQQFATVLEYLTANWNGLILHLLATALVAVVLYRGRSRADRWVEEEPALKSVMQTFSLPFSTAALLSLVTIQWLYPVAPVALVQLAGLLALAPAVRLLKRVVPPQLFIGLYGLGAFYVIDRVRSLLAASPSIEWSLFLIEMAAALVLTEHVFSRRRVIQLGWPESDIRSRMLAVARTVLLILFSTAIVAAALGYARLGALLGDGALASGYAAILLYASAEALEGLWTYVLRSRLAGRLHFVRNHRWLLQRRGGRVIRFLILAAWVVAALRFFALLAPLGEAVAAVLGARFARGNLSVSLGDVVLFGLSVWAAVLVSRFVRFVLAEDLYQRVQLPHGASYALSTLLHYTLMIGGFLVGIAAVGVDMSRFAIVAGALGVGIGFGLQNIVNNFVSGLILLFERPIQVGDAVEVGPLSGEVRRIGIRSSTIRTWEGSELIVPNGALIADTVTNWTLSDRMRRIEIPIGVAYGTDPRRVLQILGEVANAHPDIIPHPAVVVLFTGFGDSSLDFVVRGWTADFERWVNVRSELMVAIAEALQKAEIEIPFPQRDLHVRSIDAAVARSLSAEESSQPD